MNKKPQGNMTSASWGLWCVHGCCAGWPKSQRARRTARDDARCKAIALSSQLKPPSCGQLSPAVPWEAGPELLVAQSHAAALPAVLACDALALVPAAHLQNKYPSAAQHAYGA